MQLLNETLKDIESGSFDPTTVDLIVTRLRLARQHTMALLVTGEALVLEAELEAKRRGNTADVRSAVVVRAGHTAQQRARWGS
jgi:hypothetical protein